MVRLNLALSTLLLANVSAIGINSRSKEFIKVMRNGVKDPSFQAQHARRTQSLTKRVFSKSKPVRTLEQVEYYENAAADDAAVEEEATDDAAVEEEATDDAAVEEEATDDAAAEEEATDDAAAEEEEEAVADDAAAEEEEEEEEEAAEEEVEEEEYDYANVSEFDLSKYSLKMHSCRSITSFNFEEGRGKEEEEESTYPFSATPVVSFRLCPTTTCHDNSWRGCKNHYGNYMISLEEYLDATVDHEEDELEEYCDYCKQCMYFYNYFNAECAYYEECQSYADVCNSSDDDGADDDENTSVTYSDLMQCTAVSKAVVQDYYTVEEEEAEYYAEEESEEVEYYVVDEEESEVAYQNGYNRRSEEAEADDDAEEEDDQVYLQIFCDGAIKIGVFSDDECTNYIGHATSISEQTGLSMVEDEIQSQYLQHDCLSCSKKHSKYYVLDQETAAAKDDDGVEEDYVYDICETMYEESAKCNAKLGYSGYYDEEWEGTMDSTTCSFIQAVQKGNIDKYGFVQTSTHEYFSGVINGVNNKIMPDGYYLTDGQFFGLAIGTVLFISIAVYALGSHNQQYENKELKASLV